MSVTDGGDGDSVTFAGNMAQTSDSEEHSTDDGTGDATNSASRVCNEDPEVLEVFDGFKDILDKAVTLLHRIRIRIKADAVLVPMIDELLKNQEDFEFHKRNYLADFGEMSNDRKTELIDKIRKCTSEMHDVYLSISMFDQGPVPAKKKRFANENDLNPYDGMMMNDLLGGMGDSTAEEEEEDDSLVIVNYNNN